MPQIHLKNFGFFIIKTNAVLWKEMRAQKLTVGMALLGYGLRMLGGECKVSSIGEEGEPVSNADPQADGTGRSDIVPC